MAKNKPQIYSEDLIKLANRLDLASTRPERVYKTIVEKVAQVMGADQVCAWQFIQAGTELKCIAVQGRAETHAPKDHIDLMAFTPYLMMLQTSPAIPVPDITTDGRLADFPKEYWIMSGIKSSLHIPIRALNKVEGILRVDSRTQKIWSEEEIQFCREAATLISQVFAAREVEIENHRKEILKGISTDITHTFNLTSLLNNLMRKCVETLDATDGILYLADPDQKVIVGAAGYLAPSKSIGKVLRYGDDVAGMVAETGQDLLIKDYRTWSGRIQEAKKKEPAASILSVPLRNRGEIVGVLQVTRQNGGQPFVEHDRSLVTQFANAASLAFEKDRLTVNTSLLKRFQESLVRIFQTANNAPNTAECLEAAADHIIHALGVTSTLIRIDGDVATRDMPQEADRLIETELEKRSKQFDLTVVVSNLDITDMGYPEISNAMQRLRAKAYILKPIRINSNRSGFICVASRFPRTWLPEEIRMVEIASQQIGLAVQGMRFHREAHSQTEVVKRLTNVTSMLNRLVTLDEIIPMVGQGAVRLSNASKLAVMLREQDGVVRASWVFGMAKPEFAKVVEKEGERFLELLSGHVEPLHIRKIVDSQIPQPFKKHFASENINSARITPIIHSGNVIGVIVACDETPMDWPRWEMDTMTTFANTASLALQSIWLYEQLEKGYLDLALSLANTVDARESEIRMASARLAEWSQRTAQLLGLSDEEQDLVRWAALLHDIGKVEVPDEVLRKPGPLSTAERKVIEQYPVKSEKLLSSSSRYQGVGRVLRYLHERFDGKGYPDKKKGEEIPITARILAVADAYGSMTDNRPYRQAHSHEDAVQEIMKNSGTQFDPNVVNAFLQTVSHQETIH